VLENKDYNNLLLIDSKLPEKEIVSQEKNRIANPTRHFGSLGFRLLFGCGCLKIGAISYPKIFFKASSVFFPLGPSPGR
jgi:hypothetical protein